MRCTECGGDSKVKDGRIKGANIFRRKRECLECGYQWTTYEIDIVDFDALDEFKELADMIIEFTEEEELKVWEKKKLMKVARFYQDYEIAFEKVNKKIAHTKGAKKRCSVSGCSNFAKGNGLCAKHYAREFRKVHREKKLQKVEVIG